MAFDRHSHAPSFLGNVCLVVGASESGMLVLYTWTLAWTLSIIRDP